jgi:hypothetical protein
MIKTKTPKNLSLRLLAAVVLSISIMHACDKGEEDCQTCTAHLNGSLIATKRMCTEPERDAFRDDYPGHEIICRN